MNPVPLLLHVLGSTSFAYAIYYDVYELKLPEHVHPTSQNYGGHAKYLTFLNMCLQLIFFTLCILADFSSKNSGISKAKDIIFAAAAFPIGIFVAVIFWGLYALDRELIFPTRYDGHFPVWLNHLMHTTVFPLQFAEMFLVSHKFPKRNIGLGLNALLTVGYLVWIHVIFYNGGFWVYPVFQVLTPATRPIFMAFCCALGFAFYFLGEIFNELFWETSAPKEDLIKKARRHRKEK